jgi:hypothetical protein
LSFSSADQALRETMRKRPADTNTNAAFFFVMTDILLYHDVCSSE